MGRSIAVFGAGPGLGRAVARRYAEEGYSVVLVARHQHHLEALVGELHDSGFAARAVPGDLADTDAVPRLAERVRAGTGNPDVVYYGNVLGGADPGFCPAATLDFERLTSYLPATVGSLLALVREFLPAMVERGDGAVLSAQGASALRGMPGMSGSGPALAAQRNYLQSLHAEVADRGVYVGGLYIGAAIENTPFHARLQEARASGHDAPSFPSVAPAHLAELLWMMHTARRPAENTYPENLFIS